MVLLKRKLQHRYFLESIINHTEKYWITMALDLVLAESHATKSWWRLSAFAMKLLPEVSTLPSLVAISLVKMKIYIFQIVTGTHVGHMINISQHPARFSDSRHCVCGDIIGLVYHMISLDNLIKASFDFLARGHLRKVTIPPSLVVIGTAVLDIHLLHFFTWSHNTAQWKGHVTL